MKETKWVKPLKKAAIHIIEHRNMHDKADNGIYVGISYPGQEEGGMFIQVAGPNTLNKKGIDNFAEALDTMLCNWLEANRGKLVAKARSFSKEK